ncbi:MAG: hypothetical protein ACLQFR_23870 [Streptosporangiaceae bacterium]
MQPDDEARLVRLERQVSYLVHYLGIDPELAAGAASVSGSPAEIFGSPASPAAEPPTPMTGVTIPPQLAAALQGGKMIEAIKIYRGMTGTGLNEAKTAVEAMARDMGVRH